MDFLTAASMSSGVISTVTSLVTAPLAYSAFEPAAAEAASGMLAITKTSVFPNA